MAGDWIKMRVGLTTHPRVRKIAQCLLLSKPFLQWAGFESSDVPNNASLRVTRYVTVTALLRFWGYANEHAKGEEIDGVWPEDVDEVTGVPGFGDAIESAGWVVFDRKKGGLSMPNFEEHNVSAIERSGTAAERQRRYRERKKAEAEALIRDGKNNANGDVTRDVTVTPREEKRREEKSKEEKTKTKAPPAGDADLFPDVDLQVVADFKALRKLKKAAITQTAMDDIVKEAGKANMTLDAALRVCCSRGWAGFKAEWVTRGDDRRGGVASGGNRLESRHSGFENIDYSEGIEDGRIV